jgi:methionyl-tRNA formyltransferase
LSRRIAVAATAPFGADVLERLSAHQDVRALVTRPDAPSGRGRKPSPSPAKVVAGRLGIPVLEPERLGPGFEVDADVVVAVAYGLIVPEAELEQRLWLNVHPSLLPRWRGAAPVERALMAGDAETGVTVIKLVRELDAGPIAVQEAFAIAEDDDAGDVFRRAAEVSIRLLEGVLADPHPPFREQIGDPSYAEKIDAADRMLDLDRPATELVNQVRALSPHIGARSELHGRGVTIWRARIAADGSFEPVEVQPDGGRRMAYDAWLRGLRS